ncbi:MAG TPA: hypothetical protein DIT13_06925, partial [Verrucomicrobiales bacterium]|nr:hypothetical protein [Verrucomicrobiales bacterium]
MIFARADFCFAPPRLSQNARLRMRNAARVVKASRPHEIHFDHRSYATKAAASSRAVIKMDFM